MPSLDTARRMSRIKNNGARTVGQIIKEQSDFLMEETWDNDPQSKVCYIYDYYHDDSPDMNVGMDYKHTTKTRIDAKFIVTKYSSINSDQVEYHLMFKPSQPRHFEEDDELYYYETNYVNRYKNDFAIGLYVDIADDIGVYHKWLIVAKEIANSFVKFSILPCDYKLCWIESVENKRIKRQMWGCLRNQNS